MRYNPAMQTYPQLQAATIDRCVVLVSLLLLYYASALRCDDVQTRMLVYGNTPQYVITVVI
jgi:hypothetical protein